MVKRELHSLYEVKSDGVLQSAVSVSACNFPFPLTNAQTHINWKRMRERSSALEGSDKSITESISASVELVFGFRTAGAMSVRRGITTEAFCFMLFAPQVSYLRDGRFVGRGDVRNSGISLRRR